MRDIKSVFGKESCIISGLYRFDLQNETYPFSIKFFTLPYDLNYSMLVSSKSERKTSHSRLSNIRENLFTKIHTYLFKPV